MTCNTPPSWLQCASWELLLWRTDLIFRSKEWIWTEGGRNGVEWTGLDCLSEQGVLKSHEEGGLAQTRICMSGVGTAVSANRKERQRKARRRWSWAGWMEKDRKRRLANMWTRERPKWHTGPNHLIPTDLILFFYFCFFPHRLDFRELRFSIPSHGLHFW